MRVTLSTGKAVCGPKTFGTMERRCGLDELDVAIKVHWQAIFGRTHEDIAVLIMLPYVEFLMAAFKSGNITPKLGGLTVLSIFSACPTDICTVIRSPAGE